jgi:hypothetical protein
MLSNNKCTFYLDIVGHGLVDVVHRGHGWQGWQDQSFRALHVLLIPLIAKVRSIVESSATRVKYVHLSIK